MMRSLTGHDLFASIMMTRQIDRRLILVVESEEDCGVVDPHLDESAVQSMPGFGKSVVLEAADLITSQGALGILCLVDADFDNLPGGTRKHPSCVITSEFYDLDADVLFHDPSAIRTLAINFSKRDLREVYLASRCVGVEQIVMEVSVAVGVLRMISVTNCLNYSLNSFPMQYAVEGYESGSLLEEVIRMADLRSSAVPPGSVDAPMLRAEMARLGDPRIVCRGHDMLSALSVLIRRWGGGVGHKEFESAARARVSCQVWTQTRFYKEVASWASQFKVQAWTCLATTQAT